MPPKRIAGEQDPHPPVEQEELAPAAKRPRLEPAEAEAEAMELDRPYRDFVESEARRYWQEMVKVGSLNKPARDEIRAAAMPILCQAQRRRTGWSPWTMALHGVNEMQLHASKRGWIKPPYSRLTESPSYIDALTQLADDAGWLAKEIPLPDHPPPRHPPIYYTINPATKKPVPRRDAVIHADYVHMLDGSRITTSGYIDPCHYPDGPYVDELIDMGFEAVYTLYDIDGEVNIRIYWAVPVGAERIVIGSPVREEDKTQFLNMSLKYLHFSPYPP